MSDIENLLTAVERIDWARVEHTSDEEHYGDWLWIDGKVQLASGLDEQAVVEFMQHAPAELRRLIARDTTVTSGLDWIQQRLGNLQRLADSVEAMIRAPHDTRGPAGSAMWRLTLECGHFRLDGPWDVDEPQRHMIGDMTFYEVCPRRASAEGEVMLVRQIVNVERVPIDQYRGPDARADAERREGLGLQ
ncbi:hypothetical protein ACIBG4_40605 [Nonomuraea sp. NPDC050383]|uniref:hypothetical protein n=1 Tax=Nonomuraea sp. NPDC050383 TaxID=3364362 RepID=UPI0037B8EA4F